MSWEQAKEHLRDTADVGYETRQLSGRDEYSEDVAYMNDGIIPTLHPLADKHVLRRELAASRMNIGEAKMLNIVNEGD